MLDTCNILCPNLHLMPRMRSPVLVIAQRHSQTASLHPSMRTIIHTTRHRSALPTRARENFPDYLFRCDPSLSRCPAPGVAPAPLNLVRTACERNAFLNAARSSRVFDGKSVVARAPRVGKMCEKSWRKKRSLPEEASEPELGPPTPLIRSVSAASA
jgi:hypothetical protein